MQAHGRTVGDEPVGAVGLEPVGQLGGELATRDLGVAAVIERLFEQGLGAGEARVPVLDNLHAQRVVDPDG